MTPAKGQRERKSAVADSDEPSGSRCVSPVEREDEGPLTTPPPSPGEGVTEEQMERSGRQICPSEDDSTAGRGGPAS